MPAKRVPCRPSAADSDLVIQIPLKISCTQVIQIDPKVSPAPGPSSPRKTDSPAVPHHGSILRVAPLIDSL